MKKPASRWLAVLLALIAIAAFTLAARLRHRDAPPAAAEQPAAAKEFKATVVGVGKRPIKHRGEHGEPAKGVRLKLPEQPAIGRTIYVNAHAPAGGDGSLERPLVDLQAALCDLGPGDRLIIYDGNFRGPLTIGEECEDGTSEAPIEVYAAADVVLHGGEYTDEPVLTVARAYWHLNDLMVVPLESLGGGVVLRSPARDIVLESPHVRSGRGNGIEIHPGVESVLINDAHLHHLGIQEGGGGRQKILEGGGGKGATGERVDPAKTPPGAGIRIYPGTRGIRILSSEIRNIWGYPVEVVAPEAYEPRLPPAAELEIDDTRFVKGAQERWW